MGVITIECADRIDEPCACCGGKTTRLTRFVRCAGDAHAVYYPTFTDAHRERTITVLLSLGKWHMTKVPRDRVAFGLRIRATKANYEVTVIDAGETMWADTRFLGRKLKRATALKHPWMKEVFHITDHIVTEDRDVQEYLDSHPSDNKRGKP